MANKSLEEELFEAEKHLEQVLENTPEKKALRAVLAAKRKIKDREIKRLRKALVEADKEVAKANKEHEEVVKDARRIKAEYVGHDKRLLHAKAEVQRTVSMQLGIQAQLRKLEKSEQPKEKTLQQAYNEGSSSLWSGGKGKVSKIRGRQKSLKDPYEISEEAD